MRLSLKPWLLIACGALVASCGSSERSSDTGAGRESNVTVETECADAPDMSELGQYAGTPQISDATLIASLCWDLGGVRPYWPNGLTKEDVLAYTYRVCDAGRTLPPPPQEWYEQVDGPSYLVDDFALAIVDTVDSGRTRGFGIC
jgi:hypothetical protein